MKHRVVGRRLDRTTEHRTAMLRNLVTSLLRHEKIVTTTPKAKELKRYTDKFITLAKTGTPHARRTANRDVRDVEVLNKLFDTLGERFKARQGGYTRIIRVGRRHGDNAEMSVIELVDRAPVEAADGEEKPKAAKTAKATKEKAAPAEKPAKKTRKAKAEE
jgi:large subunit ribosomal protein L17